MVGALGVLLVAIITIAALPTAAQPTGKRPVTDADFHEPWENPDPMVAENTGDVWSGAGQAVIQLDGLDPLVPLLVEQLDEFKAASPSVRLALTGPEAGALPASERPVDIDLISAPYYAIPGAESVELWVSSYDTAPWQLRITVADDLDVKGGTVSGVGSDVFLYTGDATSARASVRGGTSLRIDQVLATGRHELFDGHASRDRTIAWPDSPSSVFIVESYGSDTPWTIKFYETSEGLEPSESGDEEGTQDPEDIPAAVDLGSDG